MPKASLSKLLAAIPATSDSSANIPPPALWYKVLLSHWKLGHRQVEATIAIAVGHIHAPIVPSGLPPMLYATPATSPTSAKRPPSLRQRKFGVASLP